MSTRMGNPSAFISTTAALGSSGGRTISLPGSPSSNAALITAVSIVYTASATAGNRIPTLRFLDSLGNILWSCVFGTAVTATQVTRLLAGAGVPAVSTTTPLQQTFPLPSEIALPIGSSMQILDAANIDTTDTVQANVTLSL